MSAVAINIITQRNLKKKPQFVIEGSTPSTYHVTPNNPVFIPALQDAILMEEVTPTAAENRIGGQIDRKQTTKTFEDNKIKVMGKILATDDDFLKWFMNLPGADPSLGAAPSILAAANTPDESRTWLQSYIRADGTEEFKIYTGCKPLDYSISADKEGYMIFEGTMSFFSVTVNVTGFVLGTYATELTTTPLTHLDAGANPFTYNAIIYPIESFSISGSLAMGMQDVIGSVRSRYCKPSQRSVSGSIVIYKQHDELQNDARNVAERPAAYVLDIGAITFTFTNFKFMPSSEDKRGDNSEATKESKSWEASGVTVS